MSLFSSSFFFLLFLGGGVMKLDGGGSVINGADTVLLNKREHKEGKICLYFDIILKRGSGEGGEGGPTII